MQHRRKSKWNLARWAALILVAVVLAVVAGAYLAGDSAADHMQQAQSLIAKGDRFAAMVALKNVLQSDADNAEARWLLGNIYLDLRQGASALKELERAKQAGKRGEDVDLSIVKAQLQQSQFKEALARLTQLKPSNEVTVLKGEARFGLNAPDQAKAAFQKALANDPNHAGALRGMAHVALLRGDHAAAQTQITRSIGSESAGIGRVGIETSLLKGEIDLRDGKFEDALATYEAAEKIAPNAPAVLLGLVSANLGLGRLDEADKILDGLYEANPTHPLVNYLRAISAQQAGDTDTALTAFREVLRLAPNHPETLLLAGALHYTQKEYKQAEAYLNRLVEHKLEHPTVRKLMASVYLPIARKLLASAYLKLDQAENAIHTLEPLRDKANEDPQILATLGLAYIGVQRYQEGTELLESAAQLDPEASAIRAQLAIQQMVIGKESEAVQTLQEILAVDPNFTRADLLLVYAFLQREQWDKAIAAAAKLAGRQPGDPLPLNLSGIAYRGKGEVDKARAYFSRALKLDPKFHNATLHLADMDIQAGDVKSATQRYESILAANPDMEMAALRLARIYITEEAPEKAEQTLLSIRNNNKSALRARLILADGYLLNGRIREGVRMAKEAVEIAPKAPQAQVILARSLDAQGNSADAQNIFKELTQAYPDNMQYRWRLGESLMRSGNHAAARANLETVLQAQGDNRLALSSLARLDARDGHFASAIQQATRVSEMSPKESAGYLLLGDVNMAAGQAEAARSAYQKAFALAPSGALARLIARVDIELGSYAKAAQGLREWLLEKPDDHASRLALATLDQSHDSGPEAARGYEAILAHSPNNVIALNNLAWIYHKSKDPRALEYAKRAYQLAKHSPAIVDTYGWLLVLSGKVQQGLTLLKKAATGAPGSMEIRYHLAYTLVRTGEKERAKELLEEVIASPQELAFKDDARNLLNILK